MAHDIQDEQSPLLAQSGPSKTVISSWQKLMRRHIVTLCLILIVLLEIGAYLQIAPLNKVMEDIICHEMYQDEALVPDDARCKSTEVQGKLAFIRGWSYTFDCLPSLLTSIPYGIVADKYGRKFVLALSLVGIVVSCCFNSIVCLFPNIFPIWMVLFASLFCFIGGGGVVFTSMIYVMVADVVPDAERATVFFRLGASILVGEMLASPLSAILMEIDPWLSISMGLVTMASCGIVVALMPETLGLRILEVVPEAVVVNDDVEERDPVSSREHLTGSPLSNLKNAAHFIWGNNIVMILLFTFLLTTFGRFIQEMLLQYATKRYGWTWSKAAYLLSLRAFSTLVLLLVVLPACSYFLVTTLSFPAIRKDLWLARTSIILLSIGAILIAFAATPALLTMGLVSFSLGGGYPQVIRSLLTSIVEPHFVGTLYNTIAMAETIGLILAGPLLASAFKKGLELGGAWIGMPFMVAAVLFMITTVAVFVLRLPDAPGVSSEFPSGGAVVPEEA